FGLRKVLTKCLGCRLIRFTYNRPPSQTSIYGSRDIPVVGNMIPTTIDNIAESSTTILPIPPLLIGERSLESFGPSLIVNHSEL
ncbi:MAG: hypothetical protein WB053_02930, partial [Nitrososphaeraceae archaeon]